MLRRIDLFASHGGKLPALPVGDALDDATVLIAGRGPLYPALSVAIGERVNMVGALSVETAAKHLDARDIDGIVIGDGFSPRMVEAFLTVLARGQPLPRHPGRGDRRRRRPTLPTACPISTTSTATRRASCARMVPLVRMHAFEARLKRMLKSLDTDGMFDPRDRPAHAAMPSGAISRKRSPKPSDRSLALSLARFPSTARSTSAPARRARGW